MITFKPKPATKKLLAVLPVRTRDILEKRYGIGAKAEKTTLEAIGKRYGVTRERVRQIENHALVQIQKSDAYQEAQPVFAELQSVILGLGGGVLAEETLLENIATNETTRHHVYFLLVLGSLFQRDKENTNYIHRWHVDKTVAERVERALRKVSGALTYDELVSEEEIINRFRVALAADSDVYDEPTLKRWLLISKDIGCNPLGEWGHASSPNVRVKGIRDYAYLVVKRHGSPMHFREVAAAIYELFAKKAHVATTHNELIKDQRFVLVGRGLYALNEWGYSAGVVKEVLRDLLTQYGPLSREEIIDKVRKERYVKDNTIVVNLQDPKLFRRLANGAYALVE